MIDAEFLSSLSKFNLIVRKRVTSNYSGAKKSVAQGKGMIFKDHRIYAPGDDFRAIDWKVYARTDHLMIKNFEEERNLVVHVLVDSSASMDFGKLSKFDYAAMLGVGYAYVAMKKNDKFQFSTFADDIEAYQPKRGLSQVMAMIDYLNNVKPKGKTDILTVTKKYSKLIGSRSMVVMISDFLSPIEDIKEAICRFKGSDIRLIQVLDPIEIDPTLQGDFKLKDSESKDVMRTYLSPKAKEDYLERLRKHSTQIEEECNRRGIQFYQFSTATPIFDAFYRILR